jgi:hypothetical protein
MRIPSYFALLLALGILGATPLSSSARAGTDGEQSRSNEDRSFDRDGDVRRSYHRSKLAHARAQRARQGEARQRRLRAARYRASNPWYPFVGPPGLF